jgi:hypothetical protein
MLNYRHLVIRFLTGAWCLSCFVLVTAYSSVLVSFLTAPDHIYTPLVNSVNELRYKAEIRVTLNKGLLPNILFKVQIYIFFFFLIKNDKKIVYD